MPEGAGSKDVPNVADTPARLRIGERERGDGAFALERVAAVAFPDPSGTTPPAKGDPPGKSPRGGQGLRHRSSLSLVARFFRVPRLSAPLIAIAQGKLLSAAPVGLRGTIQ